MSMHRVPSSHAAKHVLLVLDVQNQIVEMFPQQGPAAVEALVPVIAAARGCGVPVIYIGVAFRPGYPEVSPRNKSFSALIERRGADGGPMLVIDDLGSAIHPAVEPAAGEVLVLKKRVSAFAGSDLAAVLRAQGAETLVLTGIATSGVVLSTLREAADLDYRLVVLSDCCADGDPEVHRVLTEKVFPRQAEVMSGSEWIATLA